MSGPGSRLIPIANAVLTAKPVYMYDTTSGLVVPDQVVSSQVPSPYSQ